MYQGRFSIGRKHKRCGGHYQGELIRRETLKEESKVVRKSVSPYPERRSSRRRGDVPNELFKHMLIMDFKMPIGFIDPKINIKVIVNSLADICAKTAKKKFGSNTFHYSVDVVLRYLSMQWTLWTRQKDMETLLCVYLACLSIASKYEDEDHYSLKDDAIKFLTANYPNMSLGLGDGEWMKKLISVEQDILFSLEFQFNRATALWFTENTVKCDESEVVRGEFGRKEVARCLLELAFLRPAIFSKFNRSQIGAAATFVAGEIVNESLEEDVLKECAQELTKVVREHFAEMSGGTWKVIHGVRLRNPACFGFIRDSLSRMEERRKEDEMDLD